MSVHYEFPLESVLNYRRIEKNLQEARLMEVQMERDRLTQELVECRTRVSRMEEELALAQAGSALDIAGVIIKKSFIRCLRHEESRILDALDAKERDVAERRRELMEKVREHKVMERLRERDHAAHCREAARKEEKDVDEMVLVRRGHLVANY